MYPLNLVGNPINYLFFQRGEKGLGLGGQHGQINFPPPETCGSGLTLHEYHIRSLKLYRVGADSRPQKGWVSRCLRFWWGAHGTRQERYNSPIGRTTLAAKSVTIHRLATYPSSQERYNSSTGSLRNVIIYLLARFAGQVRLVVTRKQIQWATLRKFSR